MPGPLPLVVKLENAAPVKIGKGKMSYWLLSFFIYGTGDTISALRSFLKFTAVPAPTPHWPQSLTQPAAASRVDSGGGTASTSVFIFLLLLHLFHAAFSALLVYYVYFNPNKH